MARGLEGAFVTQGTTLKNEKAAQRVSFWDGYPADIRGSFARISRPKTSVRALKSWKNRHLGADIHDPKARTSTTLRDFQKLRAEKLWAKFLCPKIRNGKNSPKRKFLLRTPRPATGAFRALWARSVPGVSPRVFLKRGGVSKIVCHRVSLSVQKVSEIVPESPGPSVHGRTPFQGHPQGHSLGHFGPFEPERPN